MKNRITPFAALVLIAELCSAGAYITAPINVRVTHVPEWFRTANTRLCFTALNVAEGFVPPTADRLASGDFPIRSQLLPVASWSFPDGAFGPPENVALVTDGRKIIPGNYILEGWLDLDGDGKYDPGEPYGCEKLYGLGETNAIGRVGIELNEVSPVIARMDLAAIIAAMPSTTNSPPAFAPLAAATDCGRWSVPYANVAPATTCGTNKPPSAAPVVRVRVVRDRLGIQGAVSRSVAGVVSDRYFDLSSVGTMSEACVLADGMYDLDWGGFTSLIHGPPFHLTNVQYRIVIGNDDAGMFEQFGNNLPIAFSKFFEQGDVQTPTVNHECTVATNISSLATNYYPIFSWSHTNSIAKPYPAFCLRVYTNSAMTYASIVYDSREQRSPARDSAGRYSWTAPIHAGMTVTAETYIAYSTYTVTNTNVHTFSSGRPYWWSVSMLDAKFFEFGDDEFCDEFIFPPSANGATY